MTQEGRPDSGFPRIQRDHRDPGHRVSQQTFLARSIDAGGWERVAERDQVISLVEHQAALPSPAAVVGHEGHQLLAPCAAVDGTVFDQEQQAGPQAAHEKTGGGMPDRAALDDHRLVRAACGRVGTLAVARRLKTCHGPAVSAFGRGERVRPCQVPGRR